MSFEENVNIFFGEQCYNLKLSLQIGDRDGKTEGTTQEGQDTPLRHR